MATRRHLSRYRFTGHLLAVAIVAWAASPLWPCAAASGYTCQSCFAQCNGASLRNRTHCDCDTGRTCRGAYCFARVELWHDERAAAVQKGCASEPPAKETGCQYAGSGRTIECFCRGDGCNTAAATNGWQTAPLPYVDCCSCNAAKGELCMEPNSTECARKCRGNYCLLDHGGDEQACGAGRPRLWTFLRSGPEAVAGGTTCVLYQGGHRPETSGCACTRAGDCNRRDKIDKYEEKHLKRSAATTNFCYSLSARSRAPFNETIFNSSTMCEGHFCFITLTTSDIVLTYLPEDSLPIEEMSFYDMEYYKEYSDSYEYDYSHLVGPPRADAATAPPLLETHGGKYAVRQAVMYDLHAGCGYVDDASKAVGGCYSEYAEDTGAPLRKHCVCASHMCNYYYQLTGEHLSRLRSSLRPTDGYDSKIERMGDARVGPASGRSFVGRVKPTGRTYQESATSDARGSSVGTRQVFTHDLTYVVRTSQAGRRSELGATNCALGLLAGGLLNRLAATLRVG